MLTVSEKKLTDSRKRDKSLANNRKSHHPIETLGEVTVRKMFDNTTQASLFYCLINQSEFADASISRGRGEQNGVIIAGVPFLLSPIPSSFLPTSLFPFLRSTPPPPPPLTPIKREKASISIDLHHSKTHA